MLFFLQVFSCRIIDNIWRDPRSLAMTRIGGSPIFENMNISTVPSRHLQLCWNVFISTWQQILIEGVLQMEECPQDQVSRGTSNVYIYGRYFTFWNLDLVLSQLFSCSSHNFAAILQRIWFFSTNFASTSGAIPVSFLFNCPSQYSPKPRVCQFAPLSPT